jgi:hypothetical protein
VEDIREIVKAVVQEFVEGDAGHKAELAEERQRREGLELRVNELVKAAAEAERSSAIRAELQRLGVAKVDLAYRAVKDEISRADDGKLVGQGGEEMRDYLMRFVGENPELLPARLAGGSGASAGQRSAQGMGMVDLEKIRPDMSAEERERVRQEIARVASQTLRGL